MRQVGVLALNQPNRELNAPNRELNGHVRRAAVAVDVAICLLGMVLVALCRSDFLRRFPQFLERRSSKIQRQMLAPVSI